MEREGGCVSLNSGEGRKVDVPGKHKSKKNWGRIDPLEYSGPKGGGKVRLGRELTKGKDTEEGTRKDAEVYFNGVRSAVGGGSN